jgi:hypothetical protein
MANTIIAFNRRIYKLNCFLTRFYLLKNNSVAKAMQIFFAAINLKTIQFIYTTLKI